MDSSDEEVKRLIEAERLRYVFDSLINTESYLWCKFCKQPLEDEYPFCVSCGLPNANFNEESFYHAHKTYDRMEVLRTKCEKMHEQTVEHILKIEAEIASGQTQRLNTEWHRCPYCGKDCSPPEFINPA